MFNPFSAPPKVWRAWWTELGDGPARNRRIHPGVSWRAVHRPTAQPRRWGTGGSGWAVAAFRGLGKQYSWPYNCFLNMFFLPLFFLKGETLWLDGVRLCRSCRVFRCAGPSHMQLLSQRPFFVGICRNAASTKSNYLITSNYPVKSGVVRQFLPFLWEPIRWTSELSLNDIRGSGPAIKSGNHEKKTILKTIIVF